MGKDAINMQPNTSSSPGGIKKLKKIKKINLLRNPFSDSGNTSNSQSAKNRFMDRHSGPLGHGGDSDSENQEDDDGEEQARVVQARRDALASLDPKNKGSRTAEFKSLKTQQSAEMSPVQQQQHQSQHELQQDPTLSSQHYQPPSLQEQPEQGDQTVPFLPTSPLAPTTFPMSFFSQPLEDGQYQKRNSYRDSSLSTPKAKRRANEESSVPEIAISLATPSPPSHRQHRRISSVVSSSNPTLLSSTFIPSPLSTDPSSSADETDEWGLPPVGALKAKSRRSTQLYKNLFHRIGLDGGKDEEEVEDHIGARIDKTTSATGTSAGSRLVSSSVWSLKRNTFGIQGHQSSHQPRRQYPRKHKTGGGGYGLDPFDSGDDMLIPDPSEYIEDKDADRVVTFLGQAEDASLRGQIGGRRGSMGEDTKEGLSGRVESWMVHPRTAAIRGIVQDVLDENVPVPTKQLRPLSLSADYTTISLVSPPAQRGDEPILENKKAIGAGSSLSRGGSLDSSYHRMRKGASSLLMVFDHGSENMAPATAKDEKMLQMTNESAGANSYSKGKHNDSPENFLVEQRPDRSSSTTFGLHMSPASPPLTSQAATFLSFSSFRELVSAATGLARSSSVPGSGNASSPSVSPRAWATLVRRSRTSAFAGLRNSQQSEVEVNSDASSNVRTRRKKTLAMTPRVVVPQNVPIERGAISARTLPYSPNSASSSVTMISSGDGLDQPDYYDHAAIYSLYDDNGEAAESDEELSAYRLQSFQQLTPMQLCQQQPQQEGLLKVPEPTATVPKSKSNYLAMSAMSAARRTLSRSLTSLSVGLTSDDYIGQFERERAQTRHVGVDINEHGGCRGSEDSVMSSDSCSSLATTIRQGGTSMEILQRTDGDEKMAGMGKVDGRYGYEHGGDLEKQELPRAISSMTKSSLFGLGFLQSGHGTGSEAGHYPDDRNGHDRQHSGNSEISDKLMHLPEPSRFEGVCSCRGVINITSMLLILCGLLLLVLGYPIATGLKKVKLAEEAAHANSTMVTGALGGKGQTLTHVKFLMANSTTSPPSFHGLNANGTAGTTVIVANSIASAKTTAGGVKLK